MAKKSIDKYFSILHDYFDEAYTIASKDKFVLSRYDEKLNAIYNDQSIYNPLLESLFSELRAINWDAQQIEVNNIKGYKVGYAGSVFSYLNHSSTQKEFIKKAGLYADTIVIEENIFNTLFGYVGKTGSTDFPVKYFQGVLYTAIEMLSIEELFKTTEPICALNSPLLYEIKKHDLFSSFGTLMDDKKIELASNLFNCAIES